MPFIQHLNILYYTQGKRLHQTFLKVNRYTLTWRQLSFIESQRALSPLWDYHRLCTIFMLFMIWPVFKGMLIYKRCVLAASFTFKFRQYLCQCKVNNCMIWSCIWFLLSGYCVKNLRCWATVQLLKWMSFFFFLL